MHPNKVCQTVTELNYTCSTVSDVITLVQRSKALNNGSRKNMASNAARGNAMTSDDLWSTYRNVRRMTAGAVFGKGNVVLGPEVRDEVVCRVEARRAYTANQASKKKRALQDLQKSEGIIQAKMAYVSFNLTLKDLTTLCRWKKTKEDGKMPTKRPKLEALWKKIEHHSLPNVSPENSDAEEEDHDAMNVDEITSKDELEDEVVVPPSDVDWIFDKEGEGDADDWEKYNDDEAEAGDQSSNREVVGV